MRAAGDAQRRWRALTDQFQFPSLVELKQTLKSKGSPSPCDEGLRSVCWRAFLLHEDVHKPSTWLAQIETSRDAYTSLRSHFLKYIERPDDVSSAADPLAEDEELKSPWQILRHDENIRTEIYQDVERCLQENHFFREPTTKARMLDILFIYTKLNPDLGYRQGMHELLAPVLWVVAHDAIDKASLFENQQSKDDAVLFQVLDANYIEHDSFTLFCAIMQTAKQFYEHNGLKNFGDSKEPSPIIVHSQRIHQEVLRNVDADLADHLHTIEILPQIFLTRWIRLLYGREFPFQDMLSMWDLLFSENLSLNLIELVCVAMLLRIRQPLLDSDYSSALGLLLRYPSPEPFKAVDFVLDALFLAQNSSPEGAASIISRYTGKLPRQLRGQSVDSALKTKARRSTPQRKPINREPRHPVTEATSPSRSPAIGQKRLDSLFHDVSEGIYRRTENWGVAKVVRGAVGEARRNMQQQLQSSASSPGLIHTDDSESKSTIPRLSLVMHDELHSRISALEDRNKLLANLLGEAMANLISHQGDETQPVIEGKMKDAEGANGINQALDKIKYVQSRLENSELSVSQASKDSGSHGKAREVYHTLAKDETQRSPDTKPTVQPMGGKESQTPELVLESPGTGSPQPVEVEVKKPRSFRVAQRAPLAESQFSWILGDTGPRSSFMTCASAPPERDRGTGNRPNSLFGDGRSEGGNGNDRDAEDDVVALNSLRRMSKH